MNRVDSNEENFNVCLSHDVDKIDKSFQFVTHFLKRLAEGDIRSAAYQVRSVFHKEHYWCFEKIMGIERERGLKSTFFFLNETFPVEILKPSSWKLGIGYYDVFNPRVQGIIKELDSEGWEIGLHGSYLSFKDGDLLKKEKNDLEKITGHCVPGVRQHYLNMDEHTWERQAEAGFHYDASFGYTRNIGFREDRYVPFNPIVNRRFHVVPLALMDFCVMRKKETIWEIKKVLDMAEEKKACLVLNWHQHVFNDREFPGWTQMYLDLIDECKRRKAHFCTIGEYVNGVK